MEGETMTKSTIFEPFELDGITFKNRILRSATLEGLSDEQGKPAEQLIRKHIALAKGGVGGIITGFIGVNQQGKSTDFMAMINNQESLDRFKDLTSRVHEFGTPIIAQLNHCGGQAKRESSHMPVVAPSKISDYKAKEMSELEINEVIEAFAGGIRNAKEAGFDGVQLHIAHGYLLSEFVSPRMNKRRDKWGGNTENRFRIIKEIFEKAKKEVGDYPIIVKLNGFETLKNGMTIEESIKIAKLLEQVGCKGIEVSNGTLKAGMSTMRGQVPWQMVIAQDKRLRRLPGFMKSVVGFAAKKAVPQPQPHKLYNLDAAAAIKKAVKIPVIVVGGITTLNEIEAIISEDKSDLVSMSRAFIIEPDLVNKFKEGKQTQSKCIHCNYCILSPEKGPLKCYYGTVPQQPQ
ncbi:NADH:flavin oxidoreductase [Anaerocolumna xylanovorans]|uniref:2,4-dienoyl-CoA reductase n=1 Tax=Anaerocolumna xylanovorans DSM 12503 TaxID=1121345 RepID=A0A1M7YIN1_9FIRM|nr:NADH:flavin oxidoreductase [Anaerocolumna xylanovorans]SHO52459.1 2,4-dienoyl-CoA reductase [Anaerocolumna xylanovorans DSM 12503]